MSAPATGGGIIGVAVRRPVTTLMFAMIIGVLGIVGVTRLPVDLLPRIEFPSVTVLVNYAGTGAVEMESLVLRPLEEAVASVPGLRSLNGQAREGNAVLFMEFKFGSDVDSSLNEVRAAVERARRNLPTDIDPPQVFRFDPNQFPIVFVTVSGNAPLAEITRIARDELKPRLSRVEGVAAVDLRGAYDREIRVELMLDRLIDLEIPIELAVAALSEENVDMGAGKMLESGREVGLRLASPKTSSDDILDVPVVTREGQPIRIRDIARVRDTTVDNANISRIGDNHAVFLGVRKADGQNTVDVAAGLRAEVARLATEFSDVDIGYRLDQSVFIERSVNGASSAALIGGLFALAILLIFLRSFRATLLVGISIPLSVLATFVLMDRFDVSLNLMTLGGLALGVGMLVDNGIVVLESIVHQLQRGKSGTEAAITGAREVAFAVAASTATTIIIFVPVLFLEGLNRIIYGQLALVVVVSLITSLVLSLTLVPAFAGRLFAGGFVGGSGSFFRVVEEKYAVWMRRALDAPRATIVIFIGVALGGASLIPLVDTELIPIPDEGQLVVDLTLPMGTPLEETDAAAQVLTHAVARAVPEAEKIVVNVGPSGWWSQATTEAASIQIELPSRDVRPRETKDVISVVEGALPKIPGAEVRVRTGGGFFLLRIIRGGGDGDRLAVQIRGEDMEAMQRVAAEVKERVEAIEGVTGLRVPPIRGRDEVAIHVDAVRANQFGLSTERVGRAVESYIRGRAVMTLRTVTEDIPVVVRLAPEDRERVSQLGRLLVLSPLTKKSVPLGEMATFEAVQGPVVITRDEGARVINIGGDVRGRALGDVVTEVRTIIDALKPPPGVRVVLEGEGQQTRTMLDSLLLGGLLALLLVYMVMAAQFESMTIPIFVMLSIPFAGVGVLLLFGAKLSTLNLYSFMGIIVLIGIVVNNAIVLVDYAGMLRHDDGVSPRESMVLATKRRLRPILMTTVTTLFGLLPVAMSQAEGAELQGPLARVVVAGLATSTLVTLFLVPSVYVVVEEWRVRRRKNAAVNAA